MSANLKLLTHASPALGPELDEAAEVADEVGTELASLLVARNGFYAFESALHVFPWGASGGEMSLQVWNAEDVWRKFYDQIPVDAVFFAEDIFGEQFYFAPRGPVYRFNPETAESEFVADDIVGWSLKIVDDFESETGWLLAHEWQKRYGRLEPGKRLVPKIPFVLGGEFAIGNLYVSDAVEGIRSRANVARQIRYLPDGATIRLEVGE